MTSSGILGDASPTNQIMRMFTLFNKNGDVYCLGFVQNYDFFDILEIYKRQNNNIFENYDFPLNLVCMLINNTKNSC